jgi:hypothetical protein
VSARPKPEVLLSECRYLDCAVPALLDILDVPLLRAIPANPQTENHVLDPQGGPWVKTGELRWDELERFRDRPASLWLNNDRTTVGVNDCISSEEASTVRKSLFLIGERCFTVGVRSKIWDGVKSRTYRGSFNYYGTEYNLSVTDPAVRNALARKPEGNYPFADVYLCISLTEPYDEDGRCHKLVAAVIRNPLL